MAASRFKRNRICLLLAILWMAVIFMFSNRPADESARDSSFVGEIILHVTVPDFEELSPAVQEEMLESITYPVRKCAHMTEYAVLAALWFGTLYLAHAASANADGRTKSAGLPLFIRKACSPHVAAASRNAFLISVLYACTDEFHQIFVPGRSGEPTDVLIDAGGAVIGLLLTVILRAAYLKIHSPEKADL